MPELSRADLACFPTEEAGLVAGDFWRGGSHGLLLVNSAGGAPSPWLQQLPAFLNHGLTVLEPALPAGLEGPDAIEDIARIVAGGVAFLRSDGCRHVSVLGVSTGAAAAAEAVLAGLVGNLHTLILIGPEQVSGPVGHLTPRVIFVVADEDDATEVAVRQRHLAPDTTQLTIFTGDLCGAELFIGQHARSLQKLVLEALPPDPG